MILPWYYCAMFFYPLMPAIDLRARSRFWCVRCLGPWPALPLRLPLVPHLPGEDQPFPSLQIAFSSNSVRSVFTLDSYMGSSREVSPLIYWQGRHLISGLLSIFVFTLPPVSSVLCYSSFSTFLSWTYSLKDCLLFPNQICTVRSRPYSQTRKTTVILRLSQSQIANPQPVQRPCRLEDQSHSEPSAQAECAPAKRQWHLLPADRYTSLRPTHRLVNLVS